MTQVLSQNEIDSLLSSLTAEKEPTQESRGQERAVHLYDFRNPERLSKDQIRILKMIHDGCARSLSNFLSISMRLMVEVKVISIDQLSYSEFTMLLSEPSCLYLIDLVDLNSQALISLGPSLVYFIIDRQLGGKGEAFMESRELTAIEESMISRIVNKTLLFLEDAWAQASPLKLNRGAFESNPKAVQIAAPSAPVLALSLEVRIKDFVGALAFCYPYFALEHFIQSFHSPSRITSRQQVVNDGSQQTILARFRQATFACTVTMEEVKMTMSEVASLQIGDIIRTDHAFTKPLCVKLNGRPKFRAHPGLVGKKVGVKIVSEVLEDSD